MSSARTGSLALRVRYNECDPMGVAHHAAYPVWFELGRTELLRATTATDYRALEREGVFLAVTALAVQYRRPARYDDVLTLTTTVVNIGFVKIEHEYRLVRGDTLLATGATTLACLDHAGKPRRLPEHLMT
jgi:acyl-CoA thioester hydrolase